MRARVAIARANREASDKYHYKEMVKDEKVQDGKYKEDVAIAEPKAELDCQASQRGCQDGESGSSSSESIP